MATLLDGLQPLLATAFTFLATPVTWLEAIAFVLALATVGFTIYVNPVAWPLAIASSLLYFGLFWKSRLYGDASLQILFAALGLWGWWQWLRGTGEDGESLQIQRLRGRGRWRALITLGIAWPAIGLFLRSYTDTDVPWWDAFPTAASVIGQWLLGRKYIENWVAWMIVNGVSISLYIHKLLWLTAVLYALFLLMSFVGWRAWRQRLPAAAI